MMENTSIVGSLSFDHSPHLVYLDLSFNHLNGSIPEFEVSKVASLQFLDLSHNQLSGTVPYAIGQLPNLSYLSLSSNHLNGIISETHLLNLSELKALDVSRNSLQFNLNHNWVPPFQLQQLWASSCILGSQFPTWLKYQRNLQVLDISNTSIIDSFPEWLWDISSNLLSFNVSHNKLGGVLLKSLPNTNPESATVWDFSFNNLSGPVPTFPQNLGSLFLSNNMFSGFVSFFCTTSPKNLAYLDLSSNSLAGPLPNCWEKFKSLKVLNLAHNRLSGRIPKSFGTLRQIKSIDLCSNNFSGEIPSLTRCRSLKFIDFGNNILHGTLPTWIGHNLHHLVVLSLPNNKIQGSIHASLCNLRFLQVLILSSNNIKGEIPHCLGHIAALSNIKFERQILFYRPYGYSFDDITQTKTLNDEVTLAWKGQTREYGEILCFVKFIDLSGNLLTGEIPQSITTLVALAGLNLSGNNLSGFIPSTIGHMQRMESLDLSRNHLYGEIPASLSNLTFLSSMNLSCNNLSGEIPKGTQLQSFDASSYVENSGLCGPPLPNQCPWNLIPSSRRVDKNGIEEDEDELINFGFYFSVVLGFYVGFWGVCGTLTLKSSWRHAYFGFFNKIYDWTYVTVVVSVARMKRRFEMQHC
ncbi:unnamed protein product [Sphenostylis stenocarpa]|uniref:Non-specific serine/threonine protein kinase n=1 Tax=Sphenostylis stenocarpa TaxID=92480 RepID=A0AA86VI18_9FABA|nr:unnamed protein product [Sphenostylis stenocarpa]